MIYFTSDTHLNHANIIKYCNRPFDSVEQMNEHIITQWNSVIQPHDLVYHLGDFALGKKAEIKGKLDQLNGHIHLLKGNHDSEATTKLDRFVWVKDMYELKVPDEEMDVTQVLVLCHYPIESWNHRAHGAWHLHGHCHGTLKKSPDQPARFDIGVDVMGYTPLSYEEIKTKITQKFITPVDHHQKEHS